MSYSFDELCTALDSIENQESNSGLKGKSLNDFQGRQLFLTAIPNGGPALLIYPTSKEINKLKKESLHGIDIRNVKASINGEPEKEYLGVICRDISPKFREPFLRFTDDLHSKFDDTTFDTATLLKKVLHKWKYFWSPIDHEITEEWIKGVWGELTLLKFFLDSISLSAVVNWTGPEGLDHDFQGGGIGVEVKTTETIPPIMTINNLRQLDFRLFESLFVVVCLVTRSEHGTTLDNLVREISEKLKVNDDLLEIFERKISSLGYRPHHYEIYKSLPLSLVRDPLWLHVNSDFPSITGKSFNTPLDSRIREIRYKVELTNIQESPYEDLKVILSKMFNISS